MEGEEMADSADFVEFVSIPREQLELAILTFIQLELALVWRVPPKYLELNKGGKVVKNQGDWIRRDGYNVSGGNHRQTTFLECPQCGSLYYAAGPVDKCGDCGWVWPTTDEVIDSMRNYLRRVRADMEPLSQKELDTFRDIHSVLCILFDPEFPRTNKGEVK